MEKTATPPRHSPGNEGEAEGARTRSVSLLPRTTIATKFWVAVTGIALSLFVLVHMVGNLQVFLGPEFINKYAEFLKHNIELLWPARIGLLLFFLIHLGLALRLHYVNARVARKEGYYYPRKYENSTVSSRSMVYSGLALLFFVVYHLAHFTVGVTNPGYFDAEIHDPVFGTAGAHDVYSMVLNSFYNPYITAAYVLAMVFLGLHMWHGVQSTFQSLGANMPRWRIWTLNIGHLLTLAVVIGNILIPVLLYINGATAPEPGEKGFLYWLPPPQTPA